MKKIITFVSAWALFVAMAAPVGVAFAQASAGSGSSDPKSGNFQIVPCTGVTKTLPDGTVTGSECDFNSLIEMTNRVIKFLLYLSIPFVLAMTIYTAFQFLTSNGNPVKLEKAKHMLWYVGVGLLWILLSFILVYTVLDSLLSPTIKNDSQGIWRSYFQI